MNTYTRSPEWTVSVLRPDYTRSTLIYKMVPEWSRVGTNVSIIEFVSNKRRANGVNNYTDLIGYEFSNQISNPAGPFSLTLVPRQDNNGLTWKDKIIANDIVFINEFGKIRYIGLVTGTSYSMIFNNGRPSRNVTISGMSIGGKLESFNVTMNKYLWFGRGTTTDDANDIFAAALSSTVEKGQNLKDIFKLIKDSYLKIVFGSKTSGIAPFLNEYFDLEVEGLEAFYPLLLRPFQQDSNNLWSIFRQVIPMPVYEIFGRFIDGKYKMICRETPFETASWDSLRITQLNPLFLISQNLSDSDNEVYTHYFSQMPNSAFSENEIYADNSLHEVSVFDEEKLAIYGYRQLMANFPFYHRDKGDRATSKEFLKQNSVKLYAWYRNNVEFQSGEIVTMSVPEEYINIGERIKYLEGASGSIEFYLEGVKRKMSYPETMTTTYSVTRGYEYGSKTDTIDGRTFTTPQVKKISQLGRKLVQAEKDVIYSGKAPGGIA